MRNHGRKARWCEMKERSFHLQGQNAWRAVLSSHPAEIPFHLILVFLLKICQSTKMNVNGLGMFIHKRLRTRL